MAGRAHLARAPIADPLPQPESESDEMGGQFVPRLVHELRGPLDGMRRFLNLALRDDCPEDQRQRYLGVCRQGVERLVDIVDALAGYYHRADSLPDDAVDANELLRQAVQLQEGKAERLAVRLEFALEADLPLVQGGSGLFQVFSNLVSNAYDAMAATGGVLTVSTALEDGHIVARVRDTGHGMPPEVVERIFTPFFTTKLPGKGMGLGLAVCREIVSRLQGRITVECGPGRGTAFVVRVPCATCQGAVRL
ncbi:HAMP domain-containing histidine kinase [bacterium]|nr:HAMP domain-containing histidine kinase [bacterium]